MPNQPFTDDESGLPNWLRALSELSSQGKPGSMYPPDMLGRVTPPDMMPSHVPSFEPPSTTIPANPALMHRALTIAPGEAQGGTPPPPPSPLPANVPVTDSERSAPPLFAGHASTRGDVVSDTGIRVDETQPDSPNVGKSRLPPPPVVPRIATEIPVREPTAPVDSGAIGPTGPSPTTPTQSVVPRHPAQDLEDSYAKVLRENLPYEKAMEAREKDLARMGVAEGKLLQMTGLMGTVGNHAAQAAYANQLAQLQKEPIHLDTLTKAGLSGQEYAKLQNESWKLDPDSPISREAQMAYLASSEFDAAATGIAKQTGQDPLTVRKELYQRTRGLNAVGIAAFQAVMKQSGDYSKQRAEEAYNYALRTQAEAQTKQISVETQNKEFVYRAFQNPNSAVSRALRATIKAINPEAASIEGFDKMSGAELHVAFPELLNASADIMKFRQKYMMDFTANAEVDDDWRVASTTPTGMVGGFAGLPVLNQEGVQGKPIFREKLQASKIALDTYDNITRRVANLGAGGAVSVSLKTNAGQELMRDMLNLSEALSATSPYAKELSNELKQVATGSSFRPMDFLFGSASGKQRNIHAALMTMNSNLGNIAKPYVNKTLEQGGIPPTPPIWLPFKTDNSTTVIPPGGGAPVQGYEFQIGNKKVIYFRDNSGSWRNKVLG